MGGAGGFQPLGLIDFQQQRAVVGAHLLVQITGVADPVQMLFRE